MKQVLLAGVASDVGKTTISLGLIQALINRGLSVQAYKLGPDYVDTAYLSHLSGRPAINLDGFMVDKEASLRGLYYEAMEGSDVAVVEGVMGLYDGLGTDKLNCSTAGAALSLKLPILLIIDGSATSTSAAAMVKGFADLEPRLNFAGVIVNRVSGERHYQLIKSAVERYNQIPCLGYLPERNDLSLPAQDLGLTPAGELEDLDQKVQLVAELLEKTLDWPKLLQRITDDSLTDAWAARESQDLLKDFYAHEPAQVSLAYAKDQAFNFYYQQNLSLLEKRGVDLVAFSPLHDQELPRADGYYFGGGYPDTYAQALSANQTILNGLRQAYLQDLPIISEGTSLIYFGQTYKDQDQVYPMLGIFFGKAFTKSSLGGFGYASLALTRDTPLAKAGEEIRGHEFHYTHFETAEESIGQVTKQKVEAKEKTWARAYLSRNCLASYLHFHLYQSPRLVDRWIQSLQAAKIRRQASSS